MTAKSLDTVPASHGDQPLEAAAVLVEELEHLESVRLGGVRVLLATVTDPDLAARDPGAPQYPQTATYPDDTRDDDDRRAEAEQWVVIGIAGMRDPENGRALRVGSGRDHL